MRRVYRISVVLAALMLAAGISSCSTKTEIPEEGQQEQTDPSQEETPDPENPENPNPENPDPDNPDPDTPDPENPDPDTPDPENPNPDTPDPGTVTVLDPGEQPQEGTRTPSHPDWEHSVSCTEFYDPFQDYLDEFGNVDYVCAQGNGTAWPLITGDLHIRMYQGSSSSKGGSYIRFRSKNGARLRKVTVGSATSTSISYYFDRRPSTRSANMDLASGGRLTADCPEGCTEVCFICMGTTQDTRWELDYVSLDYVGGFVEEDFYKAPAEYGPLVKVSFPFKENFEEGFPTSEKPTYFKYGLTAGRENLQWSTWFGSFSWQKPIEGGQSAQLRVYQEEEDYDKPQLGHLKMEYFIKDLTKVKFKYYYSEFWNKATVYYCDFGTSEYRNPQQIALGSYSERQSVRDFEYVLDGGSKHDAKVIIEIDPSTGHPSKDHYDFYFDCFVFE